MKYTLEDYSIARQLNRHQKNICPACGKKTLVRYINAETLEYIGEDIGRCDREIKCGYHKKPDGQIVTFVQNKNKTLDTLYLDFELVDRSLKYTKETNLYKYFNSLFDQKEKVDEVFSKYYVGGTKDGRSVYWQVDLFQNVRTGKIMKYRENGKRYKDANGNAYIYWVHCHINYDKEEYQMVQCPFGIHLLKNADGSVSADNIYIVESEKTALLCSVFIYSEGGEKDVFISVGGKNMLKHNLLSYLTSFTNRVYVLPDIDAMQEWAKIVNECNDARIKIIDFRMMKLFKDIKTDSGDDIGDAIVKYIDIIKSDKSILK